MATRGRKTKRTPEVEKRILDALRVGATQKDACAAAGISWETFDEWCKAFPEFSESVTRAEGACAALMAATIYQAAREQKDWRAAESWLKRRRREEWGDSLDLRKLSDEDLIERAKSLIGGAGAAGIDGSSV
jgi:hypothetical protein